MVRVRLSQDVMQANDTLAKENGRYLQEKGVFSVDLMSSPGSGKTTILERTLEEMADELNIAVIEGDVQTAKDAERVEERGAQAIQINTGGACHLDANMIKDVLSDLKLQKGDLLFIENVGNLICPSKFKLGASERAMVLSVTEGIDKPAKYPAMFRSCSVVLINKIDLLNALQMDLEDFEDEIRKVNPDIKIFPVCALTGEGMEDWFAWLKEEIAKKKQNANTG